jgi:cobalt-zinc-cadmium efflux system outer membrane protein
MRFSSKRACLHAILVMFLSVFLASRAGAEPTPPQAGPFPDPPEGAAQIHPGALLDPTVRNFTLKQALDLALAQSPTLKVAELQEREAWWGYRLGVSLPSGSFELDYTGGNNPSATSNGLAQDYTITYSQTFGSIGQIALTGKSAYQGWQIARANTRLTRITLVQQVKDAFYGVLISQYEVDVARENLELADRILDLAKKQFEAGGGPRMDLLNAQIQQAASEQAYVQAVASLKQAQNALAPLLGLRAREVVAVEGDPALPMLPLVLAALESTALDANPQIEIAAKTLEQSVTNVKLARVQALPAPALSYTYDLRTTPFYWFGASIAVPLDWGQIKHQVRQQLVTVAEKKEALESARLTVSSAVKTAYDNYQTTIVGVEAYRKNVLSPSEELMKMTQFGYKEGALPFLQVLNAQQTLRQARTQYYQLLLTGHQALDALEAAVGRQQPEPSSTPEPPQQLPEETKP